MRKLLLLLTLFPFIAQSQIILPVAGNGSVGYSGDGSPAVYATLSTAYGLALDRFNNLYIADETGERIRVVSQLGIINTYAGNGVPGWWGDTGPATAAQLYGPNNMAFDAGGNMYIADQWNGRVRKVSASGVITTFAGTGSSSGGGDGGPATAASLIQPTGVTIDGVGNVYIADYSGNNIRKVDPSGIISTFCNSTRVTGYTGDGGPATAATIDLPWNVRCDNAGNLYIADMYNYCIRKINTSGVISTVAGTGSPGYGGDGGPATAASLYWPEDVYVDGSGTIYIADMFNDLIRVVNPSGIISTIAGTPTISGYGYSGDWGPATAATFRNPSGIVVDNRGVIYIADRNNRRIRKIVGYNRSPQFYYSSRQLTICENAASIAVDSALGAVDTTTGYTDTWTLVSAPVNGTAIVSYTTSSSGGGMIPSGLTYTPSAGFTGNDSFRVRVSNGLLADTAMIYIVVSPVPTMGPITGTTGVCAGAAIVVSDTTAAGAWSSGNTGIATISSGGAVTGVAGGTTTISYSATYGCGTVMATTSVTVNPLPVAGTVIGVTSVCAASVATLTDAAAGGIWSSSNTGIATVGSTGMVAGVSAGTTTISYAVTNGCGKIAATATITVDILPTAGTIGGSAGVCVGAGILLTDAVASGVWSSGLTGVATISSTGTVTGVMAGTTTISYTVTNSCGSATATKTISVSTLPAYGTITGASSVCVGAGITLTDVAVGGVWSSSLTGIATVSGGAVTGIAAGTTIISYMVPSSCGAVAAVTTITVNPLPLAGAITGAAGVCVGATTSLSEAAGGGVWSSTSTGVATVSGGGTVAGLAAGTTTISYTVTNSCGSAAATKTVTVNNLPAAGTITGATGVCAGITTPLTDAATGGVWSSTSTGVATVSGGGAVAGITAGTTTISYTVANSCGTAAAIAIVTVNPLPVSGTITGAAGVCVGATTSLTDAATGGVWSSTSTGVATISSGGIISGVTAGATTISYTVTNSCGTVATTLAMTINALPSAGTITGSPELCTGHTVTLSDVVAGGAWSSSNTTASVSGAGVVSGIWMGTDTILYIVTNVCGSDSAKFQVTVLAPDACAALQATTNTLLQGAARIYPNPNGGTFTLQISASIQEDAIVAITNIIGQKLKEFSMPVNSTSEIKLDEPAGLYFLSVTTTYGKSIIKFLVE